MNLNYRTLNGRFNLVIISVLLLLIGITIYAHYAVKMSATRSLKYIETNRLLRDRLDAYRNSLQATESALHQYSTYLTEQQHQTLLEQLDKLNAAAALLNTEQAQYTSSLLQHKSEELTATSQELARSIRRYIHVMQHVESRYPGMPILITHLEPTNRKFSEAVEVALQEGELNHAHPTRIERDHYRIMQLFQEARYAWSMQISWFRIFVANRMGVFGEPEAAMRSNLANRELYVSKVKSVLAKLHAYEASGMLGLQQEESVQQMQEAFENYETHLKRAVDIYFSNEWRADIALLRNELQPLLHSLWNISLTVEHAVADINKLGIDRTQETSTTLAYFIWLFTGIISILLLVAYQVFQKNIRKPVLQLANNMSTQQEASAVLPQSTSNIEEINRLIDSYTRMRQQVDNRQRRLQSILDNAAEGIITIDNRGCIESINQAAEKLFGYQENELTGQPFTSLIRGNSTDDTPATLQQQFEQGGLDCSGNEREMPGKRRDGSSFYMSVKLSEMQIAGERLYTAIVADISERRAIMDHLRHMVEHDSLTGLHNRQYFNDALEHYHLRATRNKQFQFACIYIDLDNFKYINDTLGHLEGDRLLVGIARALKHRIRKSDILARLGGDEFALLLPDTDTVQAGVVAEDYRQAIADFSFIADGRHIDTGCSIGVAIHEADLKNKEDLLARADIACHMAKRAGRNKVYLFEQADKNYIDAFQNDMGWTRRIRHALEHDEFVFNCRPIVNVSDTSLHGHELRLRMRDMETNSYIKPSGFLDSAERFGLMPEIDRWVIEHAFSWLTENATDDNVNYFINLSGKSIFDDALLDVLSRAQAKLGIRHARVVFEISENVVTANPEKLGQFLAELRRFGFRVALKGFGIDHGSFAYLRGLDIDYVKIDGSFINSMHKDELNHTLVKAISDVCHTLGKTTIAEQVRDNHTLALLKKLGVDYAQDYNIAIADDYQHDTIRFRVV